MNLRLFLFRRFEEFLASEMRAAWRDLVENPERRAMSDEHVQVVRDLVPVPRGRRATRVHERPIQELRGVGRPPEGDMVDRDASVLKVDRIGEKGAGFLRGVLEIPVVIAGADHAVLERVRSKPAIEGPDILWIIPRVHKIASMHQNISVRKILYPVAEH